MHCIFILFIPYRLKITRSPVYHELLGLHKDRPGALFLDIGCGVGCDIRKAIADGFPASQVIAVDLMAGK